MNERFDILREDAKWSKMIRSTSGASRCNIYKFSQVLGLISMEKIISKRNGFVVDALFYFEPVQRFQCRRDTFSFGVPVTARVRSFAVTGDEIFVFFAVSLSKESYNNLI